jgi:hypothetical protein
MNALSVAPGSGPLRGLVGDLRQLAYVRGAELQDGPERGMRVLMFSTGGGLDFWVLADRSMDIGPLSWRGVPVAWQHPGGYCAPGLLNERSDGDTGIERALGGYLVTCGLDNARQPRNGLPLHGTLPMSPARIRGFGEDWDAPVPVLFAEGEVTTAHLSGACFRLHRRIEAPIGRGLVRIVDRVENIGPEEAVMQILYHTNFGFPAMGPDTHVQLNGRSILDGDDSGADGAGHGIRCHDSGPGPFVARLERAGGDGWAGVSVTLMGSGERLPVFQTWRDARANRNILSLEPSNCPRGVDGKSVGGTILAPGGIWTNSIDHSFADPSASRAKGA